MRIILSILFISLLVVACKTSDSKSDDVEWVAMDSFHSIMADAYHPLKDSANLAPAKEKAEAMATEAESWANGELPDKVNNEDMKTMLAELKAGTRGFADQVKSNAPDSVLAASLEGLHNKFHKITETWYGGGEEHKHH